MSHAVDELKANSSKEHQISSTFNTSIWRKETITATVWKKSGQ